MFNKANTPKTRLQFIELFGYKCSISGKSVFCKALLNRIKQYQIPTNDVLKFTVIELKGDSIKDRLYPASIVHLNPEKFNAIDLDKLLYDQLRQLYKFTNPDKSSKIIYRKNKNLKDKVAVQITNFDKINLKLIRNSKPKQIAIEKFEQWYSEAIKTQEIGEKVTDYTLPVRIYIDFEYEEIKINQNWGQTINDTEMLIHVKEQLSLRINQILRKFGIEMVVQLISSQASRYLVDNRLKHSFHFVSKNFKSSHEFVQRIVLELQQQLAAEYPVKNPIDLQIYSASGKQKSLRMVYSSKMTTNGQLKYPLQPLGEISDIFDTTIYDYVGKTQYVAPPLILQREIVDFSWLNPQFSQKQLTSEIKALIKSTFEESVQIVQESQLIKIKNIKKCPICKIRHDNDQLYAQIYDKIIVINCFRAKDHNKTKQDAIVIDYNPSETNQTHLQLQMTAECIVPRLNNAHLICQEKLDIIDCIDQHVLAVKSGMGTGKTSNIIAHNINNSSTVVYVTNRITLTQYIQSIFPEFVSYLDLDYSIYVQDGMKIICQFESLHRLQFSAIDLVVLDEIETLQNQITNGNKVQDIQHSISVFIQLIQQSNRVILSDALLTNNSISLIKALKPNAIYNIIENEFKTATATLRISKNKNHFRFITQLFQQAKTVALPVTELKTAEKIQQLALKFYKSHEIAIFHGVNYQTYGESSMKQIKDKAFSDINTYLKDVKVLIFTSSVSSGVSIEQPFDHIVGIYGAGCNICTFLQMLGRNRSFKSLDVFVKNRQSGQPQYETAAKLFDHAANYIQDTIKSPSMQIYYIANIRDTNLRKSPYFATKMLLLSNGYNVIETDQIEVTKLPKLNKIPKANQKLAQIMSTIDEIPQNITELENCKNEREASIYYLAYYQQLLERPLLGLNTEQYEFIIANIKYLNLGKKLKANDSQSNSLGSNEFNFDSLNHELACYIENNTHIAKTQGKTLCEAKNYKLHEKIEYNNKMKQIHQIFKDVQKTFDFTDELNDKLAQIIFNKPAVKMNKGEEAKKTKFVQQYFALTGQQLTTKQKRTELNRIRVGNLQNII